VTASALEVTHTLEKSSTTLRISTLVASASSAKVTSACQVSFGKLASKRMYELLGRLWGCAVMNPRRLRMRQIVDTDGTARSLRERW
jgi:hypothetical protein